MKKSDLKHFSFDEASHTATYKGGRIPSVTQAISWGGMDIYEDIKRFLASKYRSMQKAEEHLNRNMRFGTAVHKATELFDKNVLNFSKLDPLLKPYLEGWILFINNYLPEIISIEQRLYSMRLYTGKHDRVFRINKKLIMVDIKTFESITPRIGIQLEGYCDLWESNYRSKIDEIWSVMLKPESYKVINVGQKYNRRSCRNTFLSMVNIAHFKLQNNLIKGVGL